MFLPYLIFFFAGYIIGSISFAIILSRTRGINILEEGSGNAGATNVNRILGKNFGRIVFFLDFLKGFFPIFFCKLYFSDSSQTFNIYSSIILYGTIIGHCFPIFFRFRGGKGISSMIGGTIVLMPYITIFGLIVWFSIFKITKFVSLASLCFALMFPFLTYVFSYPSELFTLSYMLAIVIFIRHIPNILGLFHGTENRFDSKI